MQRLPSRQQSFKQQKFLKQQESVERPPSQQPRPGKSSHSGHSGHSDQAGRRIQAMKLLRDLPQVEQQALEQKIESGALNLSNICQAQSFFNQVKKSAPEKPLNTEQKIEVLKDLEHKSARQGQVVLLQRAESAGAGPLLPKEKERVLSAEHTELRLVFSAEQLARLEAVRGLLGQRALGMSWAELIDEMASLSLDALKDKKFGKRRDTKSSSTPKPTESVCSNGVTPPSGVIPRSRATPLMGPAPSAEPASMDAPAPTIEETYSLESAVTTVTDSPMRGEFSTTSIKERVKKKGPKFEGSQGVGHSGIGQLRSLRQKPGQFPRANGIESGSGMEEPVSNVGLRRDFRSTMWFQWRLGEVVRRRICV